MYVVLDAMSMVLLNLLKVLFMFLFFAGTDSHSIFDS